MESLLFQMSRVKIDRVLRLEVKRHITCRTSTHKCFVSAPLLFILQASFLDNGNYKSWHYSDRQWANKYDSKLYDGFEKLLNECFFRVVANVFDCLIHDYTDCIVENWLAEYDRIEVYVCTLLLEDGQYCYRVSCRYEWPKSKAFLPCKFRLPTFRRPLGTEIKHDAWTENRYECPNETVHENWTDIFEKRLLLHVVTWLKDYRWQQENHEQVYKMPIDLLHVQCHIGHSEYKPKDHSNKCSKASLLQILVPRLLQEMTQSDRDH